MKSFMSDEERKCEALSNLEEIKDRWDCAKKASAEVKYVEELIFRDFVQHIKSLDTVWNYRLSIIKEAVSEADKTRKKERKNISIIETYIKEEFFKDYNEDIKISKIAYGGYEDYYFIIYFKIHGNVHAIQIPNRHAINYTNVSWAHFGKFVFCSCPSDNYTKVLFEDWSEEGLTYKIKEYIENEFGTSTIKV